MRHTSLALNRPVTTVMVFLAVLAVGLISAKLLRLENFPDITFPGMQVTIPYPGSTPEEMEQLVVRPVEEALATLSGIEEIEATARPDEAQFTVLFNWDRDAEKAAFEVRTKLDSIRSELPAAADRILMFSFSPSDQPVTVIRLSSDTDLTDQYDTLEKFLKRPIERLEGVARVELEGVEPNEVRVLVDPTRVAAYGVDVLELRKLLESSNFSVSAGEITENGSRFIVRPLGEFHSLDDVRNLVIGGGVRVGDVATVELVAPELTIGRRMDGRPAVGIDVYKSTQANVVDVADRVIEAVDAARELPQLQGIEILVVANQADSIRSSLRELRKAGLIGAVLSFFMLLAFLRHLPTTLIVSLTVPASLLVTLGALYFLGLTLNVLTMMGMLVAIGMLVDNSVVITESIFRHRQLEPGRPVPATLAGVREVGVAVLAGTLSTTIVFLPMVFGEKNEMSIFLVHVAIPIIVAMVASLVVAQTLIPMLAARMTPPPPVSERSWFGRLQHRYERAILWALAHRKTMALVTVLILVSPVPLFMLKLAKVDPVPAGGEPHAVPRLSPAGLASDAARRAGGEAHGGVPGSEQGAARHRDLLHGVAHRRGAYASLPRAQGPGPRTCQGGHGDRHQGDARDHHRHAQLPVRRLRRGQQQLQPATRRRLDRAPRRDLVRRRPAPVVDPRARGRALRSALRRRGSPGDRRSGQGVAARAHHRGRGAHRGRRDARRPACRSCGLRTARSRCGSPSANPIASRSKTSRGCRLRCRTARRWSSAPWPTSSSGRATGRSSASTG